MNKPSKKQLTDAVTYYQTGLTSLVEGPFLSAEDLLEEIKTVLRNAPSLEPVQKAKSEAAATVEDVVVAEETADVVDPEAPAVA